MFALLVSKTSSKSARPSFTLGPGSEDVTSFGLEGSFEKMAAARSLDVAENGRTPATTRGHRRTAAVSVSDLGCLNAITSLYKLFRMYCQSFGDGRLMIKYLVLFRGTGLTLDLHACATDHLSSREGIPITMFRQQNTSSYMTVRSPSLTFRPENVCEYWRGKATTKTEDSY